MFLPRQSDDSEDEEVTAAQVKSCAGGNFDSCTPHIIIGAIVGVMLIAFLIWYYFRHRKNQKAKREKKQSTEVNQLAAERKRAEEAEAENRVKQMQDAYVQEQANRNVLLGLDKRKP